MRPVRSRFLMSLGVLLALSYARSSSSAEPAKPDPDKDPKVLLAREKERGRAFLESAARQKGAIKTRSGMVFLSLKKGTGPSAAKATSVRIGHVSKLIDGKVFDHNSTAEIDIEAVIPCWQEGIKMMKVGGSARLICPPELAFEDQGASGIFPPGSTMVYELDLRGIIK